jgi:hypothetical protein
MDLVMSVKKNHANVLTPSASSDVRFWQPALARLSHSCTEGHTTSGVWTYRPCKGGDHLPHLREAGEERRRAGRARAVEYVVGVGHEPRVPPVRRSLARQLVHAASSWCTPPASVGRPVWGK